ncbi:hypothetical protein ABZ820_37885 [Streptomyces diacarni]|uniref:Uncharacterized protein n=1 Tax=Streptomyces diacarni TaxID=2800381 RepID=A0A367EXX2_9ACTN|nr:hypothetical protein [Streptomyces diacarni]RCG22923.1 hypothetical protein DTL70_14485 [Streptomyces diacarni]
MFRRSALTLVTLFAATVLAAGSAAAADAPQDQPDELTPREQATLQVAGTVLDELLGGVVGSGGGR